MTRHPSFSTPHRAPNIVSIAWLVASFCVALPAVAQTATATAMSSDTTSASLPATSAEPADLRRPRSPAVGDATRKIFARQADGEGASTTPRPIAGDVAQKSYERYLKTFDLPIPATFTTTVKSGTQ